MPAWMLTGQKRYFSWLSSAGISEDELKDMQRFGNKLAEVLSSNQPLDQTLFQNMGVVHFSMILLRLSGSFLHDH